MGGSHARSGRPERPGRAERRRIAQRVKRRRRRSAIREVPIIVGAAVLIALLIKTFLLQAFVIPSGSMEQTIRIGDRVVVDKLTPWFGSKPERGDVVVFRDPGKWLQGEQVEMDTDPAGIKQLKSAMTFIGLLPSAEEQDLIKRVVAVGGDRVKCCDKDGRVTVNGTPIVEAYLHPGNAPSVPRFDVEVPAGRIFVMGDHRENSADSRFHLKEGWNGTVDEDDVVGRALAIAWPLDHWSGLGAPEDTFASVPEPGGGAHSVSSEESHRMIPLPTPAEPSLVMGVVALHLTRCRRQRSEEWKWGTWQ